MTATEPGAYRCLATWLGLKRDPSYWLLSEIAPDVGSTSIWLGSRDAK